MPTPSGLGYRKGGENKKKMYKYHIQEQLIYYIIL